MAEVNYLRTAPWSSCLAARGREDRRDCGLNGQLDDARRAGFRQAAPFGKPLKKHPRRPGRKAGRAYGRKGHRQKPSRVDERYDVPLPAQCPTCAGVGRGDHARRRPPIRSAHRAARRMRTARAGPSSLANLRRDRRRGRATRCASDSPGSTSSSASPFGKIATLLQQLYGLTVTRSAMVHAAHRMAPQARPTCREGRG
jgi:hypothetical protein